MPSRRRWLIGEGVFTDPVEGRAIRSMIEPGTAYDDDILGKDPQPDHFDRYIDTDEDNGGVHLNSGIPNRAFALAARELGGFAWEHAGRVWYDVLTSGRLGPTPTSRRSRTRRCVRRTSATAAPHASRARSPEAGAPSGSTRSHPPDPRPARARRE